MHSYTIDTDARKKVIIYIFILSILLSTLCTYCLEGEISNIKNWLNQIEWANQLLKICDAFGITTNLIGIPFVFKIMYSCFDKHIWKCKIFQCLHNVPDLNGRWKGQLTSITQDTTIDMYLDIKQQWSKVNFYATFPNSTSKSNFASIIINQSGKAIIGFGYINYSRELPHQYDGYNILVLDDDTHLYGRYFNNRNNSNIGHKDGNIGNFNLTKIN